MKNWITSFGKQELILGQNKCITLKPRGRLDSTLHVKWRVETHYFDLHFEMNTFKPSQYSTGKWSHSSSSKFKVASHWIVVIGPHFYHYSNGYSKKYHSFSRLNSDKTRGSITRLPTVLQLLYQTSDVPVTVLKYFLSKIHTRILIHTNRGTHWRNWIRTTEERSNHLLLV